MLDADRPPTSKSKGPSARATPVPTKRICHSHVGSCTNTGFPWIGHTVSAEMKTAPQSARFQREIPRREADITMDATTTITANGTMPFTGPAHDPWKTRVPHSKKKTSERVVIQATNDARIRPRVTSRRRSVTAKAMK